MKNQLEKMKSLTILEAYKLKSVLKMISQLQSTLQSIGFSQSSINAHFFSLLSSNLGNDASLYPVNNQPITLECITALFSNDDSKVLKQLKKIEAALYLENLSFSNGKQVKAVTVKASENPNEKAKKQKKDKKDKEKEKEKKKNSENQINIFAPKNPNAQNIIIELEKSSKYQTESNRAINIFKSTVPLQQSSLLNCNIFGGNSRVPSGGFANIFQRSLQNQSCEIRQGTQNRETRVVDPRDELRKNLRQIQFFKQFVQSQMMMEMLGQQKDGNDTLDFSNMGGFMLGR